MLDDGDRWAILTTTLAHSTIGRPVQTGVPFPNSTDAAKRLAVRFSRIFFLSGATCILSVRLPGPGWSLSESRTAEDLSTRLQREYEAQTSSAKEQISGRPGEMTSPGGRGGGEAAFGCPWLRGRRSRAPLTSRGCRVSPARVFSRGPRARSPPPRRRNDKESH